MAPTIMDDNIRRRLSLLRTSNTPNSPSIRFHHRLALLFVLGAAFTIIVIVLSSNAVATAHVENMEPSKRMSQQHLNLNRIRKKPSPNHFKHVNDKARLEPKPQTTVVSTRATASPTTSPTLSPTSSPTASPATKSTSSTSISTKERLPTPSSRTEPERSKHQESLSSTPRFPSFGSLAFNETCSWAIHDNVNITANYAPGSNYTHCTLWAQPPPNHREGISDWLSLITSGFVMAKQTGCSLRIGYAQGVNLSDFILPTGMMNWTIPPNATCEEVDNCHRAQYAYTRGGGPDFRSFRSLLAGIPPFRTPYLPILPTHEPGLKRTLGSRFAMETAMACATGVLFQLSPSISQYQPNLFSTILPTLRDPTNFVISLYIRTGHTEALQIPERTEQYRGMAERIVQCALYLEQQEHQQQRDGGGNMSNSSNNSRSVPRKVVWMLVTDSPFVKTWVTQTYSNSTSYSPRTILVTQSRGAHTKGSPSTADVAEGFLDWYLIGESNVVVSDHYGPSFGNTASFRTGRPHYKVPKKPTKEEVEKGMGGADADVCRKVEPALEYKGYATTQ